MILTALYALYQRRMADPDPLRRLPIYGFEEKGIPYILDIDQNGTLINLRSTLSSDKKPVAQQFLVPQGVKKTSGVAANLLWDNLEYVLGIDTRGKPERVIEQHAAFRARIRALPEAAQQDAGIIAVNRFLDQFTPEQVTSHPEWEQIFAANPLMTFQLHGDLDLICQRAAVADGSAALTSDDAGDVQGICLITGEPGPIERLHTVIKGVWGAQSSGANIVSFNADAYCSFGNNGKQGANAPVSKKAVFGYTTALNALLEKGSGQRAQVGDTSTVFWAEKPHDLETAIPDAFGEPPKDRPEAGAEAVGRILKWIDSGKAATVEGETRFYVLGLAPNAARISVRVWETWPLRDIAKRTLQHFADLKIARAPFDPEYPSLFRLLAACAAQGKADRIPPSMGGDVLRSALNGTPYPATFFAAALARCRAEQDVNYSRAAILKACLIRSTGKEIPVMLDRRNQSPGYHLGALFAVLERLQKEAINPNTSIRDRFFGAAMTSPVMVFTTLMRLHHHHLSKLKKSAKTIGIGIWLDKLVDEVMQEIPSFPKQLTLEEQGKFAIGYYHQRHEFFTKNTSNAE